MGWIILLIICYFIKIKMIYVYIFIIFINILRGYHLLNKKAIEEDIKNYIDEEDVFVYYRPFLSRIITGIKWIIKIEVPLLIPGLIFPFIFSTIYLENFLNIFSNTNLLFTLKIFIVSEMAIIIGAIIKVVDYIVKKD